MIYVLQFGLKLHLLFAKLQSQTHRVMLDIIFMSFLCPFKNDVAFKITIRLVIDQN